jgi:hypothetical protein
MSGNPTNQDLGCFETGKLGDFRQLANKPSFRPNLSGTSMQDKLRFTLRIMSLEQNNAQKATKNLG